MSGVLASFGRGLSGGRWWAGGWLAIHASLFAYSVLSPGSLLQWDRAGGRLENARTLTAASSLVEAADFLSRTSAPGDYAWHALILCFSGGWLPAIPLVQLLLSALSLVAVYRIARRLGHDARVGWMAAVIYGLVPVDLMVPHVIGSEAIFNPLVVFGTFFLVRYGVSKLALRDLVAAGAFYSLAALTRTELLPWLFAPALYVFWLHRSLTVATRRAFALAAILLVAPATWQLAVAPSAARTAESSEANSIGYELQSRAKAVLRNAGDDPAKLKPDDPIGSYAHALWTHPAVFAREWLFHGAKLLILPDNLDLLRFLGAFEFTGKRSGLVHTHGWIGALRILFAEMPLLVSWLLFTIVLWSGVWVLVLRGVGRSLRDSDAAARLSCLLLLSLPCLWVLLRLVTQGESRKRSPVDFVLAIFAAVGAQRWGRQRHSRGPVAEAPGSPAADPSARESPLGS